MTRLRKKVIPLPTLSLVFFIALCLTVAMLPLMVPVSILLSRLWLS